MKFRLTAMHRTPLVSALLYALAISCGTSPAGGQESQHAIELPSMESVFRIATPYGDGSGFLVHADGIVLTNAHVAGDLSSVHVQINDRIKVEGLVSWTDQAADVALIQVNPGAVSGLPVLDVSPVAFEALQLGDPIQVVGFPLGAGQTLSRGILSRNMGRTLLTDASVNPGSSGGPMLDGKGRVVGMASFLVAEHMGPGIGGGVAVPQILASLGDDWSAFRADSVPSLDRVPVMPTDGFPLDELDRAATAEDWPLDLYDISDAPPERLRHYSVRLFTPMSQHYIANLGNTAETSSGQRVTFIRDLRYWNLDMGDYSPVVIARIVPRTRQSAGAFWGNVVLGTLAGAFDTYYVPVDDPEYRASVRRVLVQQDAQYVEPIQVRFAWSTMNGQTAKTAYVVMDPISICAGENRDKRWTIFAIDEVMIPYEIPGETIEQVCSDFAGYLAQIETR